MNAPSKIALVLLMTTLIASMSTVFLERGGAFGDPVGNISTPQENNSALNETPHLTPVILSRGSDPVLSFYASPSEGPHVVYDLWEIVIFGDPGEPYKIIVNNATVATGTLIRSYLNVTYNAQGIDRAWARANVGNRSYSWGYLIIKHKQIGYTPPELGGFEPGYSDSDLSKAMLKGALGVLIVSIAGIPIVWFGVKAWRTHQGVRQW